MLPEHEGKVERNSMMAPEITHETFGPHVNTTFRVHREGEPLEVELTEVSVDKRDPPAEGMRKAFVLIFAGPKDALLPEGLYEVESEKTGRLPLYIIPIISPGERQSYQVVFN